MNTNDKENRERAETIARWMAARDRFARGLGIRLEEASPGYCRVSMTVEESMLNAVGLTHGGVTFGLADFAFAVASNTHGRTAVALNAHMVYPAASRAGDRLEAVASEESLSRRTGTYRVEVRRGDGALVGLFTGTVFRRDDQVSDWMNPQGE